VTSTGISRPNELLCAGILHQLPEGLYGTLHALDCRSHLHERKLYGTKNTYLWIYIKIGL